MTWALPIVAAACSLAVVLVAGDRGTRRLAFGYATRRRGQVALVCSGIVAATAMLVSAAVVSASFAASIRRSVVQQLGPVDEEIVRAGVDTTPIEAALARTSVSGVHDTLPMVAMVATVRGRDFVARVAQAQVVEVDFDAARDFGGVPNDTGIAGPTPRGDTAVITADLSEAIAIAPGHRVTVYAFGGARTFTIDRVLPRRGIAGVRTPLSPTGNTSLNLFVPIGTIRDMVADSTKVAVGQATPSAIVAVANRDGARADAVTTDLGRASAAVGADVRPIRRQLLDDASLRSRQLTDLLRGFSLFGVLAGIGLLGLSLSMLGRERVRAMAVLRAHGVSRRRVASAIAFEGWMYSIAGTCVGTAVAVGVGAAVVLLARHVFASASAGNVALVYAAPAVTLAGAAAVVFTIAFGTSAVTAVWVSRRHVVRSIRAPADPAMPGGGRARLLAGALGLVAAGVIIVGLASSNAIALLAGPAAVGVAVVVALDGLNRRRWLVPVAALGVFAWSCLAITVLPSRAIHIGAALFVTEALVMTGCVLAVLAARMQSGRPLGPYSHRFRAGALAVAYGRRPSRRTSLLAATYAILLFMLTVIVTVRAVYQRDTTALAHRLGGASGLEVTSNAAAPVPLRDVEQLEGVTRVLGAAAAPAQVDASSGDVTGDVTAIGIDASWITNGSPPLADDASAARQRAVYAAVVRDPTKVLVASDLYADRQSGFPRGTPRVGDRLTLRIPATGASRSLTVAGVLAAGRYNGSDHVLVARTLLDDLLGGPAVSNLAYVETAPAVNADVLAAVIDGTHLPNGAYARSFARLARESNVARAQFLDISAGYAALGLIVALVGVAVVMVDRVRERQRQIATLRAFGVPAALVRRGVRIEAIVVALAGTATGIACGALFVWQLSRTHAIVAAARSFSVPVVPLIVGTVIVLMASAGATTTAARRVARLQLPRSLHVDQ